MLIDRVTIGAGQLAVVKKSPEQVSENRLVALRGDEDEDGWVSRNGRRIRTAKPLSNEEQKATWGFVPATQAKFMQMVRAGKVHNVEDMLEFNKDEINVNYQDREKGQTSLSIAASANYVELVSVLLEARADPHIRDRTEMRYTPLELAQVIMEDEDPDFEEVVELLRDASGYDQLPKVRRSTNPDDYVW